MIRRIELRNFASHDDTELEFGNGKNVIIGATGSGKTNILQALDFAFLGDVPEVDLPELIADNSDSAEVAVEYDDPRTGQNYRIHRVLKRAPDGKAEHDCTLTNLATNEVIKKPEPVRKTLESFGVDPAVWRYIVHVGQGRFGDLLEETQERKISLDKLFRVSQLEATYQELGRRESPGSQLELRKRTNSEKITGFKRDASRLNEEQENLKRVEKQREQKQGELKRLYEQHKRLVEFSQKATKTLDQIKAIDDEIRKSQIATENATKQVNDSVSHLLERKLLPLSGCSNLKGLPSNEILTQIKELEANLQKLVDQDRTLEQTYQHSIEETSKIQSKLEQTTKEREKINAELDDVQQYLYGKTEQSTVACERCGSLLTEAQWKEHFEERRKQVTELEHETVKYSKFLEAERARTNAYRKEHEGATGQIKNLDHALPIIKQIQEQRRTIESNISQPKIKTRTELLTQLRAQLAIESSKPDNEVTDQASTLALELKTLPSRIEQLTQELNSFDQNFLNPQKKRVENAERARDEAAKLEPKITEDELKITTLDMIRKSLREIQPAVRRDFVTKIAQSANDYMKRLYGGFDLENFELTEDYEFLVTRAGYKRHARRLSGGQQVLTSMAFLLALSEVLSQLDFLILDEPTTHLDESRRTELVNVLEHLRRVPQLLIVDHHPELFEAADTRFQVNLTREGQSQVTQIQS
ncbi:MAG TPA: SMC family ATPase [Candidatus Bathyarchaeia archaeon]|nr:SMC family ATPase [Candidatus Bathyarchaeia archaeon]